MEKAGLLRTAEKKALADMTRDRYDKVISELRESESAVMDELVQKIAKKLKVNALLDEIENLENKIVLLKKAITEMGFSLYGSSIGGLNKIWKVIGKGSVNVIDPRTPAGRMYRSMTSARPDLRKLEDDRNRAVTKIWLATEKEEVRTEALAEIEVKETKQITS